MPQFRKDDKFCKKLKMNLENTGLSVEVISEPWMKRDYIVQTLLSSSKERDAEVVLIEFANDLPIKKTSKKVANVLNRLREENI
jgi:predicted N-formylglutamate amidohydrolase